MFRNIRNARSWQQLPDPNREARSGKKRCRCGVVHFTRCEEQYREIILAACSDPHVIRSSSVSIAAREICHVLQARIEDLRATIGHGLKRVYAFAKNHAIRVVFRFPSHELNIELPFVPSVA